MAEAALARRNVLIEQRVDFHGSRISRTDAVRRIVRVTCGNPEDVQTAGQSHGRPGLIVRGRRPRAAGQPTRATNV